ncbi:SDR family oxidoreductase [Maricaulis sp.]|uniref:SDR family NAD(P)-dependent oxidoreductase n=1 Tax=Maricaulis sp. TaxID=1486257 RepID=UPI0026314AC7|nr:SDR family oxidoreductase [Maricaulis sp.]
MSGAAYPSLKDRVVVVTGGGSGIGAGLTEGFARQGARVVFLDISDALARALAENLSGLDPAPVYYNCDLTDLDALKSCFERIRSEVGPVDVLINNAANDDRHTIDEVTPAYWDDRMAVNLRHQFFAAQAVVPDMRSRGRGSVINLGSISWHLALADLSLYETAKAAIEGMTRALARELGPDGIRVNCIVPGNVKTPRQEKWYTPEGEAEIVAAQCLELRIEPKDILAMALFLASDDARACTGHNYFVDAGWR